MDDMTPNQERVMAAVRAQRIGAYTDELLDHTGMTPRQQGAVIGSLVAKGWLQTERDGGRTFVHPGPFGLLTSMYDHGKRRRSPRSPARRPDAC